MYFMTHVYNINTWVIEAGRSGVQGHPQIRTGHPRSHEACPNHIFPNKVSWG